MKLDLNKEDLINLLNSVKPESMSECDAYTKKGLMKFSGNQWNENWDWVESELMKFSTTKLYSLYLKHK